jgi:hypothetical protein
MKVKQGQRFILRVFDNFISFGRFKFLWIFRNLSIQILEIRGQTLSRFTFSFFCIDKQSYMTFANLKKQKLTCLVKINYFCKKFRE